MSINIRPKGSEPYVVMSGYRQQSLFQIHQVKNSDRDRHQKQRLDTYLKNYDTLSGLSLDVVIMEVANIDTNERVD